MCAASRGRMVNGMVGTAAWVIVLVIMATGDANVTEVLFLPRSATLSRVHLGDRDSVLTP
jgi:hypothetical protein